MRKGELGNVIKNYDLLHRENCKIFKETYDEFFLAAIKDPLRRDLYLQDFREELFPGMAWLIEREFSIKIERGDLNLTWDGKKVAITIDMFFNEEFFKKLPQLERVNQIVRDALKKVYHYTGEFYFEEGVPF